MIVVVELEERDAARLRVAAELIGASPDVCARGLLVARLEGFVEKVATALGPKGDRDGD